MVNGAAPDWFRAALAVQPTRAQVEVGGVAINYRSWTSPGPRRAAPLVLVHGAGAHSHWWDHLAPLLPGRLVVALDLSGHGDSGRRTEYEMDTWSDEVRAVAIAAGLTRPILIGHSMGGMVSLRTGRRFADELSGIIVADTPVQERVAAQNAIDTLVSNGPLRSYDSYTDAVEHFRLVPPQETGLPYVLRLIATNSLRETDGRWTWKFDPNIFEPALYPPDELAPLGCRLALVHAEHGLTTPAMRELMVTLLHGSSSSIEIPAAHHHLLVDQPLPFIAALRVILSEWDAGSA